MRTEVVLDTVCPLCRGPLHRTAPVWTCAGCEREFPVVAGIPDLRVEPDPWIGLEEDREKALRLDEETRELSFSEAVHRYWDMTPSTPSELARRFTAHALTAEDRSREWLDATGVAGDARPGDTWLDVGTGTADLAAAAPVRVRVIGVDVALRWLVLARRRLAESGVEATLICTNGEHLPFRDGVFQRVLSLGTLEHCRDAGAVLREARRVTAPGGRIALRTVNRFTALAEPHVGLLGVGWLPRRWADAYVRMRSGQRYLHHRPLGPLELGRAMRQAGYRGVRVQAAGPLEAETRKMGRFGRSAAGMYDRLRHWPILGRTMRTVAPLLEAEGSAS